MDRRSFLWASVIVAVLTVAAFVVSQFLVPDLKDEALRNGLLLFFGVLAVVLATLGSFADFVDLVERWRGAVLRAGVGFGSRKGAKGAKGRG